MRMATPARPPCVTSGCHHWEHPPSPLPLPPATLGGGLRLGWPLGLLNLRDGVADRHLPPHLGARRGAPGPVNLRAPSRLALHLHQGGEPLVELRDDRQHLPR